MSEIPIVENRKPTYENFIATCPLCKMDCVFNKTSDLETFQLIAGRNVFCPSCSEQVRLVGDLINPAYEMLVLECYELCKAKHYMSCVLNLAQAFEVFFALFMRVEFLYKPFGSDSNQDLAELNQTAQELQDKLKKHGFENMRSLFLQEMIAQRSFSNLVEARAAIAELPERPNTPSNQEINTIPIPTLVPLIQKVKATSVNTLRNKVVHQRAYRPTVQEVDIALEETRAILFPLGRNLDLRDDINCYTSSKI